MVRLAQGAPSQCNMQATRVYLYQGRHQIDQILALQGGARGFSQSISNLAIVTSDTRAWRGSNQRNQIYVDGALFLMHSCWPRRHFGSWLAHSILRSMVELNGKFVT
ncbi:hypothetical protein [Mesorhizobium onobrychidis]|uniref:hypothetical protein n=1 Tax=Mesorhizobium onobrychidis TaxID=2775404 RepID=UPI0035A83699